jgi:hypothetical protein
MPLPTYLHRRQECLLVWLGQRECFHQEDPPAPHICLAVIHLVPGKHTARAPTVLLRVFGDSNSGDACLGQKGHGKHPSDQEAPDQPRSLGSASCW